MILESIFMIRNGNFGSNFEIKLYFSIIAIILCIFDSYSQKRFDYFSILIVGTIIWTLVEFIMQITGMREIHESTLYGFNIPLFFSTLLQGIFEGAFIALIGVFVGDRMMNSSKKTKIITFSIFILYLFYTVIRTFQQGLSFKDVGGDVFSRRDMFTPLAVSFLLFILVIDIFWLWRKANKEIRKRALYMSLVMIIFSTIWTIAEIIANTRWIEYGNLDPLNLIRAPLPIEVIAFTWDILIEITAAYLLYLAIPYIIGIIKKNDNQLNNSLNL